MANEIWYDQDIEPETMLTGGEIFKLSTGYYILTRTPDIKTKTHLFNLYSLGNGNVWGDGVKIAFGDRLKLSDFMKTIKSNVNERKFIGFVEMTFEKLTN